MDYDSRLWVFIADMNGDGVITIGDVWLWIKWLYFYPGDGLLYGVMSGVPQIAKFFEITSSSYGGIFSGIFSLLAWLIVIGMVGSVADKN